MQASLFFKTLRDLRWPVFWYGIGLALIAAVVVYIYPTYRDQFADFEIPEALRPFLGEGADYASPKGFLSAEFFSWAPILVVIFAIMQGTNLLGGEEASGTIDILLAQPISRRRLLLEKMAAFALGSLGIAVLTCAGWFLSLPFVDIDISFAAVIVATLNIVPLILAFGAMGVWASVALPSRSLATGIVTAVAVLSFFVNYLASLVDVIEPLRFASPFYYAKSTDALTVGMDWAGLSVLAVTVLVFLVLAVRALEVRDIGVRGPAAFLPALLRLRKAA